MARPRGRRRRRSPRTIHPARLAKLERALRGEDPGLIAQRAADALGKTREGQRLLVRVISSPGAPALREAAVYGLLFAPVAPAHLVLMRRVLADPREDAGVRGQAAEVLGSHYSNHPHLWQRRYQRVVRALVRGLDDPDPEVRYWCIFALSDRRHTWLLPKLRHIAATDTAQSRSRMPLRKEALDAIEDIEWASMP